MLENIFCEWLAPVSHMVKAVDVPVTEYGAVVISLEDKNRIGESLSSHIVLALANEDFLYINVNHHWMLIGPKNPIY